MKRKVKFKIFGIIPLFSITIKGTDELYPDDNRFTGVRLYRPYYIDSDVDIGKGTYVAKNSCISMSKIGKFCSIGPNFICGYGIHPTN